MKFQVKVVRIKETENEKNFKCPTISLKQGGDKSTKFYSTPQVFP